MTDLQSKILGLLKEIDSLCRENGIEFYLAAGTALGAVRHKGFIPWDDDADICMTKKNWEKFLKLKDKLPEGRELVSMDIDYSCGYTINRYVDSTSMRLYRYHCANPQPAGVLIDILVLDPVPDSKKALREYNIHLTEFCDMLVRATIHSQRTPYKTSYMKYWLMSKVIGLNKTLDIMKKKTFCYDESEDTRYFVQRDGIVPHVWEKWVYGKPQYVPFEDTYMPIPEYYYRHLSEAFDEEWMYVPAEIDRENHIKALDLDISYVNAMDDFSKLIDRREADTLYLKRQRKGNVIGELKKTQLIERLKLAEAKVQMDYKLKNVEFSSLRKYLADKNYTFLDDYFEEYETVQCEKQMIGGCAVGNWLKSRAPVYIDIDDEFLYVFLRNFMRKGGISKAKRILKAREKKGVLTADLMDIKMCIRDILRCCTWIEKKEYQKALELSGKVMDRFPENKYGKRLFYACRFYLEETAGTDELRKDLESIHEGDEVLLSILAQIYWINEAFDKAIPIYEQLVKESNHGLVLRHIKENLESYLEDNPSEGEKLSCLLLETDKRLGADTRGKAIDGEGDVQGGIND